MGIHNLFGVYFAVFSISALAADPPVPRSNVSATLNPTTGYYSSTNSTVRLPSGVSISPSGASVPAVSKYSGGLQQTIPTGITIDAIKKSAPLPAVVRAGTPSLKTAAKSLFRGNLVGLALGAGLSSLLAGIDALIDEDGKVVSKGEPSLSDPIPPSSSYITYYRSPPMPNGVGYADAFSACSVVVSAYGQTLTGMSIANQSEVRCDSIKSDGKKDYWHVSVRQGASCYAGYSMIDGLCTSQSTENRPISPSELDDAIDNSYNPEPSDWTNLTPHLNLDDVEITSAPTLSSNPKRTTIYDANGNPVEVQETNIWYDFDIRDNPSSSPALDLKTRQETKTYKNGSLTGTTTTTDTDSAGTATGGGGSSVYIDIPTDCEFMPTVCAFLDWFKNDDTPDDPDLSALIDNRDFTETYSITVGSKQCPADYEFTVDFIGRTYGLSFEPACDFASKMYYFVMAAAYIFAAYITIGASRNG